MVLRDDQGDSVRDEDEVIEILTHLVDLRLVEEWQPMGMGSKARGFSQRRFRITDRGYALWSQELDPIPSIADERLGD
jgi:hypothetical protein